MKKSNWIRQKPAFYSRLNVHQFSSVYFQSYYNNLSSITIYSFTFILFVMLRMKRVFYKLIWCRNWLLCTAFIDTICIKFRISLAIDYNQKQMCDVFLNDWIVSFRFIPVFVLLSFFLNGHSFWQIMCVCCERERCSFYFTLLTCRSLVSLSSFIIPECNCVHSM